MKKSSHFKELDMKSEKTKAIIFKINSYLKGSLMKLFILITITILSLATKP